MKDKEQGPGKANNSFERIKDSLFKSVDKYENLGRIDPVARDRFAEGARLLELGDESGIAELEEGLRRTFISDRIELRRTVGDLFDAFRKNHLKLNRSFHIGVITAVHDPELEAVLNLGAREKWKEFKSDQDNDPQVYHKSEWGFGGKHLRVVAAAQNQIGVVSASILATKMILRWRPNYLVMTGIAAGYDGNYGDILIAKRVFLHDSGKVTPEGIEPDPRWIDIDQGLINQIENNKNKYVDPIRNSYQGNRPREALEVYMGALGTVNYVVNDPSFMKEARRIMEEAKDKDRRLVGIEMESYGVAKAALETGGETKVLIIKSISDFGQDKTDEHNKYAAYTSAQFFYRFAMDQLATDSPVVEVNSDDD